MVKAAVAGIVPIQHVLTGIPFPESGVPQPRQILIQEMFHTSFADYYMDLTTNKLEPLYIGEVFLKTNRATNKIEIEVWRIKSENFSIFPDFIPSPNRVKVRKKDKLQETSTLGVRRFP